MVSVRTKMDGPRTSSVEEEDGPGQNVPPNMERFFRRFFGDQQPNMPSPRNRRVTGQGSGFFISADGFVVTNNHVIDKATTVEVIMDDGKVYTAKVIGRDQRTDLALLKVDGRTDFPWVKFATAQPRIGDWVVAVGNPFGLGGTVTAGIVSARGRDIGAGPYDDFLQIDAAVNRGNSGGPTFNLKGEVVGVNTAIFSPSGGNVGIAFAIPAATVTPCHRLAEGERHRHARLARRQDPARDRGDRRKPRPQGAAGRPRRRRASRQSRGQGRHQVRRRDHGGRTARGSRTPASCRGASR